MSGFYANLWIDISRRHSHSTSEYKEKPLLVQPLQVNIPSLHITVYLRPEKAGKPKEHIGIFPKIKKYLEFTNRFGISFCLVYHLKKTLRNLLYTELEMCWEKKMLKIKYSLQNQTGWNNKKNKLVENYRSNLKLKWNQQKKSHWFLWTWAFYKASHHVPGSTKRVIP